MPSRVPSLRRQRFVRGRKGRLIDDLPALENRLAEAGVRFISPGIVAVRDNRPALLIRELDGHVVLLLGR
jgi:hypothetical protein